VVETRAEAHRGTCPACRALLKDAALAEVQAIAERTRAEVSYACACTHPKCEQKKEKKRKRKKRKEKRKEKILALV
jgi:hypothetical protein